MQLTVTAGLDRGLNVANALDRDTVLVVAVYILILKLTDFVDEDTELVSDIRNIVVASLAPDGELLLEIGKHYAKSQTALGILTATSMRSLETSSMLRITFFSILTSCESFLARSGPKAPADLCRKVWPEFDYGN